MFIDPSTKSVSAPWRRILASQVAKLYFCGYFYTRLGHLASPIDIHQFVGERHNIEVCKMMYAYLESTVERLAREGARKFAKSQKSPYRVSFRTACTQRLCGRIHRRIEDAKRGGVIKAESGTTLPALADLYSSAMTRVEEHLEQSGMAPKPTKLRQSMPSMQGAMDGAEAGDKIGLDPQVERQSSGMITHSR